MSNQQRSVNNITEGVIWKQLIIYFLPILFGTFFQQLYNTADAMIAGRAVGTEALAAVGGSTGELVTLLVGFFTGLSSGATVIISQFFGARKDREVGMAVHTAAAMALSFGAILSVIGITLAPALLRMLNTPVEVFPFALTYLRIYFAGMIPSLTYNIGSGVLRAVGDSRRPLVFLIISCLSNIVLDVLFMVVLHLGVAGAALATVLAQCIAAALVVLVLARSDTSYRLHVRRIRFHGELLGRIAHIGLPAGLQSVLYSISNVTIQSAINGLGTVVVAGWTAASKMDNLYWMFINAFGIAMTTFAGQNFGAGRIDRLRKSVRVCLGMSFGMTALICTFLLLVGRRLLFVFSPDPQVIDQGLEVMRFMVPTYATYVCIEVLAGALRGAGDSIAPTLITLIGVCLVRMLWIVLYVFDHHTLTNVLASYPISWIIGSTLFIIYYLRFGWLRRCAQRAGIVV